MVRLTKYKPMKVCILHQNRVLCFLFSNYPKVLVVFTQGLFVCTNATDK